jgi:hypothetical protein
VTGTGAPIGAAAPIPFMTRGEWLGCRRGLKPTSQAYQGDEDLMLDMESRRRIYWVVGVKWRGDIVDRSRGPGILFCKRTVDQS